MTEADAMPSPPPEGILLKRARESWQPRKLSMRQAADKARVSETTWRHAEGGYEVKGQVRFPYRVGDSTLARMAAAVRVTPESLAEVGRSEAAAIMGDLGTEGRQDDGIPDDAPLCSFEQSILWEQGLPDDMKAFVIVNHRKSGHVNCHWLTDTRDERRRALA